MKSTSFLIYDNQDDPNEHNDLETFYVLDNPEYQMIFVDMMILITLVTLLILLTLMTLMIITTCMIMMILMNIMTMTHYNHDDPDDPDKYNDHDTYSFIESSAPV